MYVKKKISSIIGVYKKMKNELPIKYKEGFFSKIKMLFCSAWKKCLGYTEKSEINEENGLKIQPKESELDKMRKISDRERLKEDILKIVSANPKLIETLSVDKLKELESMYNDIIEKNDRKIKQLKRKVIIKDEGESIC